MKLNDFFEIFLKAPAFNSQRNRNCYIMMIGIVLYRVGMIEFHCIVMVLIMFVSSANEC